MPPKLPGEILIQRLRSHIDQLDNLLDNNNIPGPGPAHGAWICKCRGQINQADKIIKLLYSQRYRVTLAACSGEINRLDNWVGQLQREFSKKRYLIPNLKT